MGRYVNRIMEFRGPDGRFTFKLLKEDGLRFSFKFNWICVHLGLEHDKVVLKS